MHFKLSFTTYQIFNKVSEKKFKVKSINGERGYKKLYKLKKYRTVRGCESKIHGNSIKSA
jgi:hypothetical protein